MEDKVCAIPSVHQKVIVEIVYTSVFRGKTAAVESTWDRVGLCTMAMNVYDVLSSAKVSSESFGFFSHLTL